MTDTPVPTTLPASAYGRRPQPIQREVSTPAGRQTVFVDEKPRCSGKHRGHACNKLLAEFVTRPWSITCRHCGTTNVRNTPAPPMQATA